MDTFWSYLVSLATLSPLLLVYLAGIILAATWFSRCPNASRLAMLGFAVLLVNAAVGPVVSIWLPRYWMESRGGSHTELQWVFGIIGFVRSSISAGGMLLLLMAIYSGRTSIAAGAESYSRRGGGDDDVQDVKAVQ